MIDRILPFPLGQTAAGGMGTEDSVQETLTSSYRQDLKDWTAWVKDSTTGRMKKVRAVQNNTSDTLTLNDEAKYTGVKFGTDAGDHGYSIEKEGGDFDAGDAGAIPSEEYGLDFDVVRYDWFWVVEEGPALLTVNPSANLSAGGPVSFDGNGLAIATAAGYFVIGAADIAATTSSSARIWVGKAFVKGDPSG